MNIADGIQQSTHAIREVQPDAVVVHVEATHVWTTNDPALASHRAHLDARNFLPTDLILGLVVPADRLDAIADARVVPDVIGLNYYPELSCRDLASVNQTIVGVACDGWTAGLREVVSSFYARYGLPILISETGIEGEPERLIAWLQDSTEEVMSLRSERRLAFEPDEC